MYVLFITDITHARLGLSEDSCSQQTVLNTNLATFLSNASNSTAHVDAPLLYHTHFKHAHEFYDGTLLPISFEVALSYRMGS